MVIPDVVPDARKSNRGRVLDPNRGHLRLTEALDRILHRGVALQGEVTIGLAEVELLFLDLRVLLGSIDALWPDGDPPPPPVWRGSPAPLAAHAPATRPRENEARRSDSLAAVDHPLQTAVIDKGGDAPSSTAHGLVRLVLTLVKLLHELLERQAVRRMEAGRLTEAQIESLGVALLAQAEEILHLQRQFGLSDEDLSLELGVVDKTA